MNGEWRTEDGGQKTEDGGLKTAVELPRKGAKLAKNSEPHWFMSPEATLDAAEYAEYAERETLAQTELHVGPIGLLVSLGCDSVFLHVFRSKMPFFRVIRLATGTQRKQIGSVKTSIDLDEETIAEVREAVSMVREKPATIIRLAIRAGLPIVTSRFRPARPEGYFAEAYSGYPRERIELEECFGKVATGPDR